MDRLLLRPSLEGVPPRECRPDEDVGEDVGEDVEEDVVASQWLWNITQCVYSNIIWRKKHTH